MVFSKSLSKYQERLFEQKKLNRAKKLPSLSEFERKKPCLLFLKQLVKCFQRFLRTFCVPWNVSQTNPKQKSYTYSARTLDENHQNCFAFFKKNISNEQLLENCWKIYFLRTSSENVWLVVSRRFCTCAVADLQRTTCFEKLRSLYSFRTLIESVLDGVLETFLYVSRRISWVILLNQKNWKIRIFSHFERTLFKSCRCSQQFFMRPEKQFKRKVLSDPADKFIKIVGLWTNKYNQNSVDCVQKKTFSCFFWRKSGIQNPRRNCFRWCRKSIEHVAWFWLFILDLFGSACLFHMLRGTYKGILVGKKSFENLLRILS